MMDVLWRTAAMIIMGIVFVCGFDFAVSYDRPPPRNNTLSIPLLSNKPNPTVPQQVRISVVGKDKMRVTWITDEPTPSVVNYGTAPGVDQFSANGSTNMYTYVTYESGEIHDVVIGPLTPNTTYYYRLSSQKTPEFTLRTPPQQLPIKFAIAGDLGQTDWTKSTLDHISKSNYHVLLLPGDLAYADRIQPLWDSFGRLVEPLASQRPWMVTQGNHESEKIPLIHSDSFTSYNARWYMPYEQSGSDSNLYYSFEVAGVHVIMLGSYTAFDPNSAQFKWLSTDLKNIDRNRTPWVVALVHCPWYNSNKAHQGEEECVEMKQAMEDLLYGARVDLVFAGHVHAYERFTRVYKDQANDCGPAYIVIGDGGNREGLATSYTDPQPTISAFREASFGHGELEVVNATHAHWTWQRNDDTGATVADSIWFTRNNPSCQVK